MAKTLSTTSRSGWTTKPASVFSQGEESLTNAEMDANFLELEDEDVRIDAAKATKSDNVKFTPEGGLAIRLTNKTGAASVKGTIISSSFTTENAFEVALADSSIPQGAVYESGVADGSPCWVVVAGIAEVLLKDATPSTVGYWVGMSDAAGRADAGDTGHPGTTPPEQAVHNKELGHCLETKTAGTDVLCNIIMHFN